jgi:hypothetical protein
MSARASATVSSSLSVEVVVVLLLVVVVLLSVLVVVLSVLSVVVVVVVVGVVEVVEVVEVLEVLDALAASIASPTAISPANDGGAPSAQCAQPFFLPCAAAVHCPCRLFGGGGSVDVVLLDVVVVSVVDVVDVVVSVLPDLPLPLPGPPDGLPCAGASAPAIASAGMTAPPERATAPMRIRDRSRECIPSYSMHWR